MRYRPTILLAILTVCFALAAHGAERVLILDPEATEVTFTLEATGHDVEGAFHLQAAEIRFDGERGTATGTVTIDASDAETGNKRRDKTMREKVLESAQFPQIVFTPTHLQGEIAASGTSHLELIGAIAIHGAEHPLTLPTTVSVDGDHLQAETSFSIPYVEWGMHDPSIVFLRVAKEVVISIVADGKLTTPAASTEMGSH